MYLLINRLKNKIYGSICLNELHRVIVPETLWERHSPGGTGMRIRRTIMRGLKEIFCKIVAAVICLGMKVFSGNIFVNMLKEKNISFCPEIERNKIAVTPVAMKRIYGNNKVQAENQRVETTASVAGSISDIRNSIDKSPYHLFLKKVFYWLQGPGDRLQNNRFSCENKDLEWKRGCFISFLNNLLV